MICKKCAKSIPDDAVFCCYCGKKQTVSARSTKSRGNGTGTIYKRGDRYVAVVTLGYYNGADGKLKRKTVSKRFKTKKEAVQALPTLSLTTVKDDMTLRELWELYTNGKDYQALSKSQQDKMGYAWKRLTALEFRGIRTLTVSDLEDTIYSQVSTYYPARDMKVCLSHLYDIALKKELIETRKPDLIDLPDAPVAKRDTWTQEEVEVMWKDYETNPFTGYVLIMCYAGLRHGELARQRADMIYLDERYMIGGIKTEAGTNREIPLHTRIIPIIRRLCGETYLCQMNEDNWYRQYWSMIKRCQIRELPPQTCRHYYFSTLTANGVAGGVIAETGGHASYLTTMKNYVRLSIADKLAAIDTMK